MAQSIFSKVYISGISYVMPDNEKSSVDDHIHLFDNNPKKLNRAKKIVGYGNTYVSPKGITAVDLCEYVARDLIENTNLNINTIDALVFVSQFPDYIAPSSSCVLHDILKLPKHCATFDVHQGCTGYVYGLWTCFSLIESEACKKVLLLASDSIPLSDNKRDNKGKNLIFSSGACATLLEFDPNSTKTYFDIGSDGSGYESLIVPAGSARIPIDEEILNTVIYDKNGQEWTLNGSFMDGLAIFNFSIEIVPEHIKKLLELSSDTIDTIDFFAIHQANKQLVSGIADNLDIPNDKFSTSTFTNYGNMGGVSCISNLMDVYGKDINHRKLHTAIISYGVGLSWASVVLDIGNIYSSGIKMHTFKDGKSQRELIDYWKNKISNYSAR